MEEREFFKFEFTKTLSLAIDILIDIGDKLGISKEDMAYLEVPDIQLMVLLSMQRSSGKGIPHQSPSFSHAPAHTLLHCC